ncbi:hypothetical protein BH23PLA1_BH23PLA1_02630 [soil metagenome]
MPIHDWTRVSAGIFHDFHHEWISEIKRALNGGLLPPGYYAMAEQIAGGLGPDVLTLEMPAPRPPASKPTNGGGMAITQSPPKVRYHARTEQAEAAVYAKKAKAVVIRHTSDHRVVAMVELVSPGNKAGRAALASFVAKVHEALSAGIHLLIVDLFPPGPRDPDGLHRILWEEGPEGDFPLPPDEPLTCVAYIGGPCPEVFLEPVAVGEALPEMPLFLTPETYVPVPLNATYQAAWEAVPTYWQDVLTPAASP